METLYFTLGIASVVVAVVAVGAVWAMFKVAKLTSMLRDVEQQFGSTHSHIHRDIDMVEQTMINQINNNKQELGEHFTSLYREIEDRGRELDERFKDVQKDLEDVYKTIDSRIDKLAANFAVQLAAKREKQLIKG